MEQPLPKPIRVKKPGACSMISICERTLDNIPEKLLPRCRIGGSVGFRVIDIETFLARVASGEVTIGKVNS